MGAQGSDHPDPGVWAGIPSVFPPGKHDLHHLGEHHRLPENPGRGGPVPHPAPGIHLIPAPGYPKPRKNLEQGWPMDMGNDGHMDAGISRVLSFSVFLFFLSGPANKIPLIFRIYGQ